MPTRCNSCLSSWSFGRTPLVCVHAPWVPLRVCSPSQDGSGSAGASASASAVSTFLGWIRSPCLRHCVHDASIGGVGGTRRSGGCGGAADTPHTGCGAGRDGLRRGACAHAHGALMMRGG
eukprot:COSAG01_NODE_2636_length_7330_cov_3.975384_9_plen_120_part_00